LTVFSYSVTVPAGKTLLYKVAPVLSPSLTTTLMPLFVHVLNQLGTDANRSSWAT
jgi:hypothetical protein